ncbi:MAG: EAL domain-containing protein [Aeromonas sp.]
MPFRHLKQRSLYKKILIALLMSLSLLLVTGIAVILQTVSEIRQDAISGLQRAQMMFDRSLVQAQQAAINVEKVIGQPCREVALLLREQVVMIPDVRSVDLATNHREYCSSLHGEHLEGVNPGNYADGRLQLLAGDVTTPDRPLIILRHETEKGSVLVAIDGYYLRNTLEIASKNGFMALVVGNTALFGSGQVGIAPSIHEEGYMALASHRFPYKVVTRLTMSDYLTHAWRYSKDTLILSPLLALLSGIGTFWLLGRRRSPVEELNRALIEQEFIPYLQLVVAGNDQRLRGCEVLMRWQHPQQGMISPDRFIPSAEASGLIVPMTSLLMAQVSGYFAPLANKLPNGFHFAFNICASHCNDLRLVADCRDFLAAFKGQPVKLVLELTERELIVANAITDQLFAQLHQLGVTIAIDDFGTGHSSLAYLQQFQVDCLKIDQSFVGMIGTDALSSHIVENVIDLASRLGLQLVAEGVETQVQADYLQARQVDYLQGYFYGRPVSMAQFCEEQLDELRGGPLS